MDVRRALMHPAAKVLLFIICLLPFAWLLTGALTDGLGANPSEALIRGTGDWTLRLLCATLAITPMRHLTGWAGLLRFRRMLGVFTFFYGLVHLASYAWLDMGLVLSDILHDIGKRPFILVGTTALLLMLPLALTSFNRAIRALGAARWQRLHRLVYVVAVLALLHFWWMRAAKQNFAEPSVYIAIIAVLFGVRLWRRWFPAALASSSR